MTSAPPGWHLQPDGRERFWDGQRWTEEFRDPSTAPTQAIPMDQTQGMWTGPDQPPAGTDPYAQNPYAQGGGAYQPAYTPPPGQGGTQPPYYGTGAPPSSGMPGWLKGCLVALLVLLVIAAIGLFIGWRMLSSAIESQTPAPTTTTEPTTDATTGTDAPVIPGLPTDLPSGFPSELPSGFPTDIPSLPGAGESVEVSIGEGFSLGPAQIQPGWEVTDMSLGFKGVTMTIVPTESASAPLVFSLSFIKDGAEVAQTYCTAPLTAGEETQPICVPMRGDAQDADRVRASGAGS